MSKKSCNFAPEIMNYNKITMGNIKHSYQDVVDALQSIIGQTFRMSASTEFLLHSADANKIVITRRGDQGTQLIEITEVIKFIIQKINTEGIVSKTNIKNANLIGNRYPNTIKALCMKSQLFVDEVEGTNWRLAYATLPGVKLQGFLIQGYKNISYLQIENFNLVNLFVGANNVGKSNLLEAISLYASNFSPKRMMEILKYRHENLEYFEKKSYMGYYEEANLLNGFAPFLPNRNINFLTKNNAVILGENKNSCIGLKLKTAVYRDDRELSRLVYLQEYKKLTTTQQFANSRETVLVAAPYFEKEVKAVQSSGFDNILHMIKFGKNGIEIPDTQTDNRCKFQYVNCKHLTTNAVEDLWAVFSMTDMEEIILNALKIIDERIVRFNFIKIDSHTYTPFVQLQEDDAYIRMPISEMGEGITHILNIVIALLGCKDGILLLDEAESGLHYTVQTKLWKMIFELAKTYKVQVFATTHSNDCINAFAQNIKDEDGILYRLNKSDNKIVATPYSDVERISFALGNDIDLR